MNPALDSTTFPLSFAGAQRLTEGDGRGEDAPPCRSMAAACAVPRSAATRAADAAAEAAAGARGMFGMSAVAWPADALLALRAQLDGVAVEVVDEVDSTNSELLRRARAGSMLPTLLIAKAQTAAHGRMGRPWVAEADGALTFSLALPLAPANWSGLSLAVGLVLAETLHPDIRIKWPNDLQIGGRKVAGILIEIASGWAVIGVGVNIRAPAPGSAAAAALETHGISPAWLDELLPGITAPTALLRCAVPLFDAARTFERAGFAPLQERFAARDALAGVPVTLSDGTAGTACGVTPDGALCVRAAQGILEIRSGAISVRPAAAPIA